MSMKSILATLALSLVGAALPAQAQEAAPEAASPLSFNISGTTDYRYRGISQSRLKPALQGGVDYAHESGFYIGSWASTITWIKDGGGNANFEWDFYGGYKTEIAKGLTVDVGVLQYYYPSHDLNPSPNTFEVYGALSFGPVTAKYSHSTTNLFGFADSKGSGYFDVSATFELGEGFNLVPHVGHQTVKNNSAASYTDYSLAVTKDWWGLSFSAAVVGTDADGFYTAKGKDLGKTSVVVAVKKVF
ncbi:TorF family putative porin [Roseateles violae]|uniref:TorF family putative porin n=1 Tax=Roseateles violae TaxID=3058042 RepID=A0ABT8DNN5_9BURK|nr:TorF family putative porin [Pelomonas sp. PFR6]MDN3919578.1 TorF family putative porin [Pelomonas sp. PFR6]